MPDLNLQISIYQNQDTFEPGSTIRGTINITCPEGPQEVKSVDLVLFWRTEGIGTTDEGEAVRMPLVDKEMELPRFFTRDFSMEAPAQPYTYQGTLIKINWKLGLYVKKSWISTDEIELPITIKPGAAGNANAAPDRNEKKTRYNSEPVDVFYDENGRPQVNRPLDI